MARQTDIKELLFPVKLQPVYAEVNKNGKVVRIPVQNSQVLVNTEDGAAIGIVSKNYRVVTNQEAIEMGKRCCKELLDLKDDDHGLEVFNSFAPLTRSYCHIDLVHRGFAINLWDTPDKPETYLPYVRVTNSYNTTRSLRFDVGFCRKICLNGVIFETATVQFTFSHVRHELNKTIKFDIKKGQFAIIKEQFKNAVDELSNCKIPVGIGRQIFELVLGIPEAKDLSFKTEQWEKDHSLLQKEVQECLSRYYVGTEANAYTLFNAITDFASRPPKNRYVRRDINSMQRAAGNWMNNFKEYAKTKPFKAEDYISHFLKENIN